MMPSDYADDTHQVADMNAREDARSAWIVATAYEKALVGLGWDSEVEGADAFSARFWQTFVAMRSLLSAMRNALPDPPARYDDFHKTNLEVSYGAIRQMDAVIADADDFKSDSATKGEA